MTPASTSETHRFRAFRPALPEVVNETVRRRGLLKAGTDCAVPPECSRDILCLYRKTLDCEFPELYVIFGHIGDAHVHEYASVQWGRSSTSIGTDQRVC